MFMVKDTRKEIFHLKNYFASNGMRDYCTKCILVKNQKINLLLLQKKHIKRAKIKDKIVFFVEIIPSCKI